ILPALTHLVIEHNDHDEDGDMPILKFLITPTLQSLDLMSFRAVDDLIELLQRSNCQPTHLEIDSLSLKLPDFVKLCHAMPSLTSLVLQCAEVVMSELLQHLADNTSLLPSLRSLTIDEQLDDEDVVGELAELRENRPDLAVWQL